MINMQLAKHKQKIIFNPIIFLVQGINIDKLAKKYKLLKYVKFDGAQNI
jgi:hypothetical protein